ncbi:uncharacterized protein [Arachis hypogaea]|uniref:uncharacterized protein isoform X2 n=1 Tax=Arachis hypogaea TaxID=3818 RepID=UPI00110572F6|nr:uncharacterized protein LOC112766671 isoform X2 [Arachis hypogaea]
MEIPEQRKWMYNRNLPNRGGLRQEFVNGVRHFIDTVKKQPQFVLEGGVLRCPCNKHKNKIFLTPDEVLLDLYKYGFMPRYWCWDSHGESPLHLNVDHDNQEGTCSSPHANVPIRNSYESMVVDAAGPELMSQFEEHMEEPPNAEAKKFYDLLQSAQRPLFEGCMDHSELSMAVKMLSIKAKGNVSQQIFDDFVKAMKEVMPKDNLLVSSFYEAKKLVSKLGMESNKIDCCINGCMLYYKEDDIPRKECKFCHSPRYKIGKKGKSVPLKRMHYLPLIPRLRRLYASMNTAPHMRCHFDHEFKGVIEHPSDSKAWKYFDRKHPQFSQEPRNVRLGLCADGFTPFGQSGKQYSCWPIIVTPYNLPPSMCMKTPYMFLSMIIPGPRNPKTRIDVYLQPLIDELKLLWEDGVLTYDIHSKSNFVMRAALLWTINDFPAYGMLSGWMIAGRLACPYCMERTKAFQLKNGGKPSWFDCHRQFLPDNHMFRRNKDAFYKNRIERSEPPPRLTGEQIWDIVQNYDKISDVEQLEIEGYGSMHNWTKRSIFWDLPYWRHNLIRHNLDVMHIEKNVFDNIFNTVMDIKEKTKDNAKARMDLSLYCKRKSLELPVQSGGKIIKPKANYTFTLQQKRAICEWVKELRMPDGYVSNLGRCVDMKEGKLYGMKSHDCHIFMERLLPIAFSSLPEQIWKPITELSQFFRDLCSTSLREDVLNKLEENIPIVLCKLERIFPPGFFDSMEHLPIHLPFEALLGGPVQYRWMYPFERFLHHLKKKVKNKAHVEGSIVESYLIEEISHFYDKEFSAAMNHILINCDEIKPYIEIFVDFIRQDHITLSDEQVDQFIEADFAEWFKNYVHDPLNNVTDSNIHSLAWGPLRIVKCWPIYKVNGFKFHTRSHSSGKSTQNYGICVKGTGYGEYENDFYGQLDEIIQVEYTGLPLKRVVLFKCEWFDPTIGKGTKVNKEYGIIQIRKNRRYVKYDPFIIAHKAIQVYFAPHPMSNTREKAEWWFIFKTKARGEIEIETTEDFAYQEDDTNQSNNHISNDIDIIVDLLDTNSTRYEEEEEEEEEEDNDDDDDDDDDELLGDEDEDMDEDENEDENDDDENNEDEDQNE